MAKTFLQIVNEVMVSLRQDEVSNVNENIVSKLAALYCNQYKAFVEDACMWRTYRHQETTTFTSSSTSATLSNTTERTRIYDLPGKRTRCYDVTAFTADSTQPKSQVWTQDIDHVREMQENNTPFEFDTASYFALDINALGTGVTLERDVTTTADRVVQIDLWTPQDGFTVDTQNQIVKAPYLPIVYGATYMATQERGEELGIDGGEYKMLYVQALRDAVSKEVGEQGGYEVEADYGRQDILRRQY